MPIEGEIIVTAVQRWAGALNVWLRSRTSSPEDVVQETFCRLAALDRPPERMAAWLFQVALNLCREETRRSKRRLAREQYRAVGEGVACTVESSLLQQEVREAVEKLPSDLRDLVIARLWGELTLQETAELLQLSTTTAHRRYQESLSKLRELLTDHQNTNRSLRNES